MFTDFLKRLQMLSRKQRAVTVAVLALAGAAGYGYAQFGDTKPKHSEVSSQSRKGLQRYTPTPAEWASLTFQPVTARAFRAEYVTEGKIANDEHRSTPVVSTDTGRLTKCLVRPVATV